MANSTLKHERAMVGNVGRSDALYRSIVRLARKTEIDGKPALEQPWVRDQLMILKGFLETQRYSGFLQLSRALEDQPAGRLPLKNKVMNTDFGQRISALALELIGDSAQLAPRSDKPGVRPGDEKWMAQFFGSLALSTAGGTANIQRNILAERGLGLPRESAGRADS